MPIPHPRRPRRLWLLSGILTLAGTYACADHVAAPRASTPQLDLEASGVYVSTLWRPGDSGATYLGGITGRADVRSVDGGVQVTSSAERPLAQPLAAPAVLGDRNGSGSLSRFVVTRTIDLPSREGKRLQLRLATDPRGDGRPPMAAVVYENGRPISVSEYSYARESNGWRIVRSRSTMLDTSGRGTLVHDNDVSGVSSGAGRSARSDAVAVASRDGELIDENGEVRCFAQQMALVTALNAWTGALAAVVVASSTTCTLSPTACAAILLGAQAALATADIAVGNAIANLDRCLNPPPPPPPAPVLTPVGGGSPGPGYTQYCEYHNTYLDGVLIASELVRCWWQPNGE